MIGMSVSDVVAVATVLLFNRSGGCGTWPIRLWDAITFEQIFLTVTDFGGGFMLT
jgi:hypothetical protein